MEQSPSPKLEKVSDRMISEAHRPQGRRAPGESEAPRPQGRRSPGESDDARPSSQTARATLALREMLVQGLFRPGERIREVPLAAKLQVSRIPLHLALERLAHEGFLEVHPRRGFVV